MPNNIEFTNANSQRDFPLAQPSSIPHGLLLDAKIYLRNNQSAALLTNLFTGDTAASVQVGDEALTVRQFYDSGYGPLQDSGGVDRGFILIDVGVAATSFTGSIPFTAETMVTLSEGVSGIAFNGGAARTGAIKLVSGPGVALESTPTGFSVNIIGRPDVPSPTNAVRYLALGSVSGLLEFNGTSLNTPATTADDILCTSKAGLPDANGNVPSDNDRDVCTEEPTKNCGEDQEYTAPPVIPTLIAPDSAGNIQLHADGRVRLDPIPNLGPGATRAGEATRLLKGLRIGLRGER